ncbi:MAG: malonyl-CoA O-methyltransferase [Phenylobacterium sp.]|jgi:malonyl-CoA O-methyltransferase
MKQISIIFLTRWSKPLMPQIDAMPVESMPVEPMSVKPMPAERSRIQHQFAAACHSYDSASRLQRFSGHRLLELNAVELASVGCGPVLDLGCGTGLNTAILADYAGKAAHVIGCDLAFDMAKKTRHAMIQNELSDVTCIQADAAQLPFANDAYSLIYSNLMLQWFDDLTVPLSEIGRVLQSRGQLMFTTLLDGTLHELKTAWAAVDDDNHVNHFSQLEGLKQALSACGFSYEIVVEAVELEYDSVLHLARELKHLGANYVKGRANKGLVGKQKWLTLAQHYQPFRNANGTYPATYSVAYVKASAKRGHN